METGLLLPRHLSTQPLRFVDPTGHYSVDEHGEDQDLITIDENDWKGLSQIALDYYGTIKYWSYIAIVNNI